FLSSGMLVSFHKLIWVSNPLLSTICTISPCFSISLYQASCACVIAQACAGEFQPVNALLNGLTLANWVATTKPIFPFLNSGRQTVPFPRSGLSFIFISFKRICSKGMDKSRFHSMAFIARSKWTSIIRRLMGIFAYQLLYFLAESIKYSLPIGLLFSRIGIKTFSSIH